MGNDLSKKESERVITNASIREVTIHEIKEANDTGLIHFYLKLGKFKIINILTKDKLLLPPNKLVADLEVSDSSVVKWHQIIDLIKPSFTSKLFYKFEITQNNVVLLPQYDESEKQCFYKLDDESNYALEMAFYDTEPSSSNEYHSLKISPVNEKVVKVVAPNTIDLEARRDNRTYSLFTQTISSSEEFTYINFETILKSATPDTTPMRESLVDTTLKIKVVKKSSRLTAFAFFSVLAAISIAYGKALSDKIDIDGSFDLGFAFHFLVPISLGYISAFNLYRLFDKK